ncbi:MAG: cytochrome d ubiquinol oxidase subunit II [Alphaproteobacteria bacterium]|nr:cytochrome d ubiquinol oxidase subunit II [Alphaproteobacteria bacterium]
MELVEAYLPLIWGALIAIGVFMYVLLDGFDLGVGILFPFRKSDEDKDVMMNSVAPFWDGNETWLVLGIGGLFVAFPLAYALFLPALYLPVILMLLGLIFRGVAFEFRFKADRSKHLWSKAFFGGSLVATFFQGAILGGYIQGIEVEGRDFAGGAFDWLSAFSVTTGLALIAGYVYLGSSWLIMRTEGDIQKWAFGVAKKALAAVFSFMVVIMLWMLFLYSDLPVIGSGADGMTEEVIMQRWFGVPNIYFTPIVPLIFALLALVAWRALAKGGETAPFLCGMGIFVTGFVGLAISVWPNVIPPDVDLYEAAAHPSSQLLLLIGALVLLPVILGYTAFIYWVFRGKVRHGEGYSH